MSAKLRQKIFRQIFAEGANFGQVEDRGLIPVPLGAYKGPVGPIFDPVGPADVG
jgi:hypothetical protein